MLWATQLETFTTLRLGNEFIGGEFAVGMAVPTLAGNSEMLSLNVWAS